MSENRKNPAKGKAFQVKAASVAAQHFGADFDLDAAIPFGNPPKLHRFDLVSKDRRYVGECKNYGWTKGGNMPSAKMAFVNEAVFYLKHLPEQAVRFVIMRKDKLIGGRETLAEYYWRTYRHLLGGVEVLELDLATSALRRISGTGAGKL